MSNIFAEYARGSWCMRTSDMKVKRLSFSLAAGDPSSDQTTSTGVKFVVGVAIAISVVALLKLFFGGGVCRSKARLDGKVTMSMVRLQCQSFIKKLILLTLKVQETPCFLYSLV